ncbi:MAG: histidine phosphatase family protein [Deltaproteobacteria bacterium]|jgi:2,3-bisphosphoglycerate-dependent phosphoglycerate mutase|nr:histidine phosphatase family protein [Deltaproteobacteria bacterium]
MQLLIIRHGLPLRVVKEDNTPADPELSETGKQQAQKLAQWLKNEKLDAIYCSPMKRARMTAEPLAAIKEIQLQEEPGVAEFDQQSSEYIPMEELKKTDYKRWKELVDGAFEEMFDLESFRKKALDTLERIIAENKGKTVAVVCHGGIINTFAANVLGIDKHLFFPPEYTGISRFMAASSGQKSVITLNESGHLRDDIAYKS